MARQAECLIYCQHAKQLKSPCDTWLECRVSYMSAFLVTVLRCSWRTNQSFSLSHQSQRKPWSSVGHILLLKAESGCTVTIAAIQQPRMFRFIKSDRHLRHLRTWPSPNILWSSFVAGSCCPLLVRTWHSVSQAHIFSSRHTEWFYCNAVIGIL